MTFKKKFKVLIDRKIDYKSNLLRKNTWPTLKYIQTAAQGALLHSEARLLSLLIKTLDNSNIGNAFVSGMKKNLHLYSNEKNFLPRFSILVISLAVCCLNSFLIEVRPFI
ncbi:hypothetical protein V1514DRAFT_336801 [Lipomyces japonicus]|uniref:uncharacterized protein n=1 Tax=Lipomyces japonicus TaxID=56871 RepID=UPI0034CE7527